MRNGRFARKIAIYLAIAALLGASPRCFALLQACTVSASAVSFGPYDPSSPQAKTATGTVNVSCSAMVGLFASWTLSMSPGSSASYANRTLINGASTLQYNLFTSPAYSTIWGNGSAGTVVVSDSQTLLVGNNSYNYPIYGRIPPLQDVRTGNYSDAIVVTINY